MCDPISIVGAVIGVGQQFMAYQQAKSNVAFQNAQNNLNYQILQILYFLIAQVKQMQSSFLDQGW